MPVFHQYACGGVARARGGAQKGFFWMVHLATLLFCKTASWFQWFHFGHLTVINRMISVRSAGSLPGNAEIPPIGPMITEFEYKIFYKKKTMDKLFFDQLP
jgi:hypothetical protein